MLDQHDGALIVLLAGSGVGCSLDASPKKNWVEKSGGLPDYICKIAKGVMRSGKSKSQAIAIAVSRVKKWAAGGDDVDADTRAKAAKAAAQWAALKTKNKSKQLIKASRADGSEYLELSYTGSYNTDIVRRAWNAKVERERNQASKATRGTHEVSSPYSYVRELWSDHILVEIESMGTPTKVYKVPYAVDGSVVNFGEMVEVEQVWQEVSDKESQLNELEQHLLRDVLVMSAAQESYLSTLAKLTKK